eukprot:g13193.t1
MFLPELLDSSARSFLSLDMLPHEAASKRSGQVHLLAGGKEKGEEDNTRAIAIAVLVMSSLLCCWCLCICCCGACLARDPSKMQEHVVGLTGGNKNVNAPISVQEGKGSASAAPAAVPQTEDSAEATPV